MPANPDELSRLDLADMDAAARTVRLSYSTEFPWLAGRHTPEEFRQFFRDGIFPRCEVWGARTDALLIAVMAVKPGWLDQLYVLPEFQGRGAGSALLELAKSRYAQLELWTFERNRRARAFYEARGFVAVEITDGAHNEEKEPDIRYLWSRTG